MSESMWNVVRTVLLLIVFVVGIALVIIGQTNIGASGLGTMLLGLVLLIGLLWFYNRKYK